MVQGAVCWTFGQEGISLPLSWEMRRWSCALAVYVVFVHSFGRKKHLSSLRWNQSNAFPFLWGWRKASRHAQYVILLAGKPSPCTRLGASSNFVALEFGIRQYLLGRTQFVWRIQIVQMIASTLKMPHCEWWFNSGNCSKEPKSRFVKIRSERCDSLKWWKMHFDHSVSFFQCWGARGLMQWPVRSFFPTSWRISQRGIIATYMIHDLCSMQHAYLCNSSWKRSTTTF